MLLTHGNRPQTKSEASEKRQGRSYGYTPPFLRGIHGGSVDLSGRPGLQDQRENRLEDRANNRGPGLYSAGNRQTQRAVQRQSRRRNEGTLPFGVLEHARLREARCGRYAARGYVSYYAGPGRSHWRSEDYRENRAIRGLDGENRYIQAGGQARCPGRHREALANVPAARGGRQTGSRRRVSFEGANW